MEISWKNLKLGRLNSISNDRFQIAVRSFWNQYANLVFFFYFSSDAKVKETVPSTLPSIGLRSSDYEYEYDDYEQPQCADIDGYMCAPFMDCRSEEITDANSATCPEAGHGCCAIKDLPSTSFGNPNLPGELLF